jgi:hypothetical protein
MNNNTIKAVRSTIKFAEGLEVDGYMLPDGEFRVGKTGASLVLGYKENFLSRIQSATPKKAKALQSEGFTGYSLAVQIENQRGATRSDTLSLDDFESFIFFAASEGKKEAIALQRAFVKVGITDWFRLSFGIKELTLEEKRALFYKDYAKTINWLSEDKKDLEIIKEQELFLVGAW